MRPLCALCSLSLLCSFAIGCEQSKPSPKASAPTGQDAPQAAAAPPVTPEVTPPAPAKPAGATAPKAITKQEVTALVDAWVEAQNKGDFKAYASFYAQKFSGTKRAGHRTSEYQREGWLKDRERMFAKVMKVSAADRQMALSPASAVVTFTQTWASGSFKDKGSKQLVLVAESSEGGARALRIAKEQMLDSTIQNTGAPDTRHGLAQYAHYEPLGSQAGVLLSDSAQSEWSKGRVTSIERAEKAWAEADLEKVPTKYRDLIGTSLTFYAKDGSTPCTAKIESLGVLASIESHFNQVMEWNDASNRVSDELVAKQVFDLAQGMESGLRLVAKVDASAAKCKGALFARAQPGKLEMAPLKRADNLTAARADAKLSTLPRYAAIQKEFKEDNPKSSREWIDGEYAESSVRTATFKGRKYVYYSVESGSICDGFYQSMWALWEVKKDDSWVLMSDGKDPTRLHLNFIPGKDNDFMGVMDVNGDGKIELYASRYLMQSEGAVWRITHDFWPPSLNCPC